MKTIIFLLLSLSLQAQLPKDAQHFYLGAAGTITSGLIFSTLSNHPIMGSLTALSLGTSCSIFTVSDPWHTTGGAVMGAIVVSLKYNFNSTPGQRKKKYKLLKCQYS